MATDILLPKIGFSMEEGIVAEWLVPNGSRVSAGQPLYNLESEKSVQEIEAPEGGVLRVIAETNVAYPVGTVLARIE